MAVKTVDMVRSIRDAHFEATKMMSVEEQIQYYKGKAKALRKKASKGTVSVEAPAQEPHPGRA